MKKPIFAMIPSGYKASTLYSPIPINGDGDFTFTRGTVATRMNKDRLIEEVAANVPRLDYSDSKCPTLLLEEASTNLITYSEDLSQSYWNDGGQIRTLSGVSPSGGLAYLVEKGTQGYMATGSIVVTDGSTCTISAWLKSDNNSTIIIKIQELGGDFTNYFSKTIALTNEWVRYEVSGVKGVDGNPARFVFDSIQDGESFYAWGVQVEESEVATSYIETAGTAVTRNADTCINDNLLNILDDNKGSMFAETKSTKAVGVFQSTRLSAGNSFTNSIRLLYSPTNFIRIIYRVGDVSLLDKSISYDIREFAKFGITWDSSAIKFYANGVKIDEVLNPTLIAGLDTLYIDSRIITKDIRIYNEVLTEAEAIELTTI